MSVILRTTERLLYCISNSKTKTITRQGQFECHIGDNWTVALLYFQLQSKTITKQNNNKRRTVWVSYWRQLNGCFTVFPITKQNNNNTRTVWVSYWRQLNGFFTVFPIAKQNNNKTRTVWMSYWRQLNGCFTVFSIPKH